MHAGLANDCDAYLAAEASKGQSFLRALPATDFMEWLNLVDKCNLQQLLPMCTAHLVANWRVGFIGWDAHIIQSVCDTLTK
jgi:hypothetical protein